MRWRKQILLGVSVFLVLCGGLTLARNNHWFLPPAATYLLDVTYTNLPPNDEAIGKWLKNHSGWRNVNVARNGNKISFKFGTEQGPKPTTFRDLMSECERLGYQSRSAYSGTLVDRSQRGTNWQTFYVEYTTLPGDDQDIAAWLTAQSTVSDPTVSRDGEVVSFKFELTSPPPPRSWRTSPRSAKTVVIRDDRALFMPSADTAETRE
jgi:hypothetical protein